MKLKSIVAGFSFFPLVAIPCVAQHGGVSGHAGGAGHAVSRPVMAGTPQAFVGGRVIVVPPPPTGMQMQHMRQVYAGRPLSQQNPPWRFPMRMAPSAVPGVPGLGVAYDAQRRWILRPEFDGRPELFRLARYYRFPSFFLGAIGQPVCDPFLPGRLGPQLWFDNQFSCFGTPFFGVGFYPSNFLAPELAYEPWFENLQSVYGRQMYPTSNGQTVGALDMTAAIAARESAESNPSIRITQLVLKEGFIFGLTDYWLEDGKLHYVTVYGLQNSVDLDLVDLDKTVKLNADRGVAFVLRERPVPPSAPK